jgi:6-phosphofructokinase 1
LIEVMGRNCGYLALMAAIAGGAEFVVLPEIETDPEKIAESLSSAYERGKTHAIVVIAEGAKYNATALAAYFEEHKDRLGFDLRVTIIGHVQRGGTPSAADRILASRLGSAAVAQVMEGNFGVLVGVIKGEIALTPLQEAVGTKKPLDMSLFELAKLLD